MKNLISLILLVALSLPVLAKGDDHSQSNYQNPVIKTSVPDPTIIKAKNGYFYLYATEDVHNLPIYKSKNLVDWTFVGTAFTDSTRPTFEPKGGIWAPDINYINGKYVLYFAVSMWGGEWTCGIGVATSDKPEGPFRVKGDGKLFRSNEINVKNSIDPFFIDDNGKKYLFWGSFRGIYAIELSGDGLSVKDGAKPRQIAGTAYEATYILKKGGYYYLFASTGTCCEGLNSTYQTVVGRSKNLFGPFLNKEGKSMMDNFHETVIHKNDQFVGTGHNAEIVQDKAGKYWIPYHGFSVTNQNARALLLDEVKWVNGWPVVNDGTPGISYPRPVF